MTALPAVADATGATRNEGQFKAYMTSEHDYLAGLFGTDGVPATALATLGALGATYVAKTGAYTVVTGDRGKVIACSGTWTLGLTAVATLGAGYSCIIANTSTGTITIDPASAELIDGAATFALGAGRMVLIVCTGSAWITLALAGSVTTSSLDTTAGRVLKVGDYGAGAAAGTVLFGRANILGTVSQSAGVPTGAVIERGSNANGEYVRFADGTQICTVTAAAVDTTTAAGAVYMHTNLLTWTFPAAFAAAPVVAGGCGSAARWLGPSAPGVNSVTYRVYSTGSSGTLAAPSLTAIGRWF